MIFMIFYDLIFISAYADHMERSTLKYTRLQVLLLFIDAGLGATHLGRKKLFELGEGDTVLYSHYSYIKAIMLYKGNHWT